jgi:hypothetical protein
MIVSLAFLDFASFSSNGSCSVLEGEPCLVCPHDHWCADNALTACGANEFAPANSSQSVQLPGRLLPRPPRRLHQVSPPPRVLE